MTGVIIRKGEGTGTQGRRPREGRDRAWSYETTSQGMPGTTRRWKS